jgi:hypothetical protein
MRKSLCAALVVAATAVGAAPAAASHSWGNYHWARTANPFGLKVGTNLTADWLGHFETARADWDASSVMNLTAVAGSTTGRKCRATSGRVEVCNASYGRNGWLGLATISISGGHISSGTVKMNDTYFSQATWNNPNERLHVMCQEIGHDWGLGHTSEDGSSQNTCMDYFSNTGANATSTVSTHPNAHDYQQLETIYGHLDAGTTIQSSGPGKGPSLAEREDSRPYRSERHDARRFSVLTERFADDSIRITHFTWAAR